MGARLVQAQERVARLAFNHTHPVDEYQSTPGIPAPDGSYPGWAYNVQVQPTWEVPERIESLIATIPAGATACIAKLGDRWIDLLSLANSASDDNLGIAQEQVSSPTLTGTSFVWVNTTGQPVLPTGFRAFFTADAVVANRFGVIQYHDAAGNILVSSQYTTAVVASTTIAWNAFIGASQSNSASGFATVPLPSDVMIPPGGNFTLSVANEDVADTLSQIELEYQANSPLNNSATVSFNGLGIVLNRDDDRLMLLNGVLLNGPTHFELMGYADEIWGNA